MRRVLLALCVAAAVAAGTTAAAPTTAVVKTAYNKTLKATILVDARGLTLYYYAADSPTSATCVNDPQYHCSKLWPPLLTGGKPKAGTGAKASLLGTVVRPEHTTQVTYKGHPLYRYAGGVGGPPDKKPGDVYGQGVLYEWYVLSPAGKPIKTPR